MGHIKEINIKSRPYYFFNDMINITNFDQNLLSIDKISFKSIDAVICNIKYITMKSLNHVNIDSANPPYVTFNNVDGYTEESNGDKYVVFASTAKNKKLLVKYTKVWIKLKSN